MLWVVGERSAFFRVSDGLASRKGNRNSRGTAFLVDFSKVFVVLIWFCYGSDMVLIRFWYNFDMVLIRFWIWFRWVGFKSQFWPTSRIITETISKSYLKPYQHHNCKTTPETIHTNKSYLKRIKIIKIVILKNLHPRDFGCYKNSHDSGWGEPPSRVMLIL